MGYSAGYIPGSAHVGRVSRVLQRKSDEGSPFLILREVQAANRPEKMHVEFHKRADKLFEMLKQRVESRRITFELYYRDTVTKEYQRVRGELPDGYNEQGFWHVVVECVMSVLHNTYYSEVYDGFAADAQKSACSIPPPDVDLPDQLQFIDTLQVPIRKWAQELKAL